MNSTSKSLITVFLAAVLGLTAASAQAFRPGPPGPGGEGPGPGLMAGLDLSEDQIAKLKAERLTKRKQMIKWEAELKILHLDIKTESHKDKPSLAQVEKLAQQIGELRGKMMAVRVKSVIYLRSILTPKQKLIMDEMQLDFGHQGFKSRKGHYDKRDKR
ncbi:periplasmic heavy metal sensor, partial [bacterium]|nr:periplasmic heavy metal sensor [bacterium]